MIQETNSQHIDAILSKQKQYFASGVTKNADFKVQQLKKLRSAIIKHQDNIIQALWTDLHKSEQESYLTEISIVLQELKYHLRNVRKWSRMKKIGTPIHLLPSQSYILSEPLGNVLIMAPWNYPFQLLINPLIGAISGGNTVLLKPSPDVPNVALALENLIKDTFADEYVAIIHGAKPTNEILFTKTFDLVFFTGSPMVGKLVMKAASEKLTPVVLELGGKSPCVVDADANIEVAAKRIAWGKTINAGQTCIAPDYLLVHEAVKDELFKRIAFYWEQMYGKDIKESPLFPRIVNDRAMERLSRLLKSGKVVVGGAIDMEKRYISPTILDNVDPNNDAVMKEEIFGPILPAISFSEIKQATDYIAAHEKPLAFYYFGHNKNAKKMLETTTSGGACINDTIMHIANHHLPFGGVGNSGLGKYHGKQSFLAFTNQRAVVNTPVWIDLPLRYPPFKYFKLIKKVI